MNKNFVLTGSVTQKKTTRKCFLVFTFGILGILSVGSLLWVDNGLALQGEALKWARFIGRLHPIFLHLPIGALTLVFFLELTAALRFTKEQRHTTIALFFASLTAFIATMCGYGLDLTGQYEGELFESHKKQGILFTILVISTFLIKYLFKLFSQNYVLHILYWVFLIASTFSMIVAGHQGGEITHGKLFENKKEIETPQNNQSKLVFYKDIIHPILESKCISCHGSKKKKSGLRMDSYQAMLQGGEETDCLIPGDVKKSAMIAYLHLPIDDDLRMPPEGKKQLTDDEIKILEWWVKIGAPEKKKIRELNIPQEIQQALNQTP